MVIAEHIGTPLGTANTTGSPPAPATAATGSVAVRHAISPRWALLPLLVGVLGIASRQPGLTMAGTIVLLALAVTLIWGRWALAGVECRQWVSTATAHFGDDV